jgi:ATP-dependent DNA helicase RecQ
LQLTKRSVSEWGDDFRKEYQQLFELRSFFKVPVMAFTATSTKKVKGDIMEHLQLIEDNTDVNGTTLYNGLFRIAPFDAYMFN